MNRAEIVAAGMYVPEQRVTNDFFVKSSNNPYKVYIGKNPYDDPVFKPEVVTVTDDKIVSTTGIKERRRADDNQTVTDLISKAFSDADFPASKLEGIIIASISDEMRFPSLACRVQKAINADKVSFTQDIGAACSGFTHALDHARLKVQETGGYYLVAGVETLTRITDYTELNCNLFGDGCGLVILGPTNAEKGILAAEFMSDMSGLYYIFKDKTGKLRMPEGPSVFRKATRGMIEMAHKLTGRLGLSESNVSKYIPHQANGRIVDAVESNIDPEKTGKIIKTVDIFGNMSAATVPVAFAKSLREGTIKKDDLVTMVDMGSGLTFGSALLRV